MLIYCKTCGSLYTPHAFKLHRDPICLPFKNYRRLGLFPITLSQSQIKHPENGYKEEDGHIIYGGYPTDMYWASMGMFHGLSRSTIPWEWLKDKGILPTAWNRL